MKDNVLLRTENMSRKYVISDRRETEIEVLKDINLEIREQEFISIMGKSGSGKTTLLKLLGLIDRPTSGKLYFKGQRRTKRRPSCEDQTSGHGIRIPGLLSAGFIVCV